MPITSDTLLVWKESDVFYSAKVQKEVQVYFCVKLGDKLLEVETQNNDSNASMASYLQIAKAVRWVYSFHVFLCL